MLPRVTDVVEDALEALLANLDGGDHNVGDAHQAVGATSEAYRGLEELIELVVLDFADAFFIIPLK